MKRLTLSAFLISAFLFTFSGCRILSYTDSIAPQPVSEVQAVSEEGKIILTWQDPLDTDLMGIKIYNGQKSEARSTLNLDDAVLVGKGLQRYEVANLEDGQSYTFKLSAVDKFFNESEPVETEPVCFAEKVVVQEVTVEVPVEVPVEIEVPVEVEVIVPVEIEEDKIVYREAVKEGTYSVYHMQQNISGGKSLADYSFNSLEENKVLAEETLLENLKISLNGFTAASMAQHNSVIYVFYDRNLVTYTFNTTSKGSFEDGTTTKTVTGLYGTLCEAPENPSNGSQKFIRWKDTLQNSVPETFDAQDNTFTSVWLDEFVKIEYEEGDFYICQNEVTYANWYEIYNWAIENGYTMDASGREGSNGKSLSEPSEDENQPVTCVSWKSAIVWCNAASEFDGLEPVYKNNGEVLRAPGVAEIDSDADGYRLPSCAEWEYAARGGEDYTYSGSEDFEKVSWCSETSNGATHSVMTKAPNGYGLYDMSGNVWEWCQDENPEISKERIIRGGSYYGNHDDSAITSFQSKAETRVVSSFGFRLVRSCK